MKNRENREYRLSALARSSRLRGRCRGRRPLPWVEALESRRLLTVTISEFPTGTIASSPFQIASGPDNNLWFADQTNNRLGRMTTAGTLVDELPMISPDTIIEGLASGPDGNMWVAQGWNGNGTTTYQVSRVTPSGDVTSYATTSAAETITAGPDGLMWFTENSGTVGSIDPTTGTLHEYRGVATGVDLNKHQAAFTPDGALWFTEYGFNKVARFDTTKHTVTEVNIGSTVDGPNGLAVAVDGGVWYTTGTSVCRIDPTTQKIVASSPVADGAAIPEQLTLAADGNLWFSSNYSRFGTAMASDRQVGRIDPTGAMTAFPIPTDGADINGVADGPDGNLWFSDMSGQLGMATLPGSDVKVQVQSITPTVSVGDQALFFINVQNNGPSVAKGVHFSDTLPAGLGFSSLNIVAQNGSSIPSTNNNGVLDSDLGDLPPGAVVQLRLRVVANAVGTFSNPATITSRSLQTNPADNAASASVTVNASPLAIISAGVSPPSAQVGQQLTYTVVIENKGTATITGVQLTDVLPSGLTFVSGTPARNGNFGTFASNGKVTSDLGDLAPGDNTEVQIVVAATAVGSYANQVNLTSQNTAGASTVINSSVTQGTANLAVTEQSSADTVRLNDNVTYTLKVTNNGPSKAFNTIVTDTMPAAFQPVSVTVGNQAATFTRNSDGSFSFGVGDLANGASVPVTIQATAVKDGTFTNQVAVTSATAHTDASQSTASVDTTVLNLAVSMQASSARVHTGDTFTYTVAVTNNGTVPAPGVRVTDTLPAGLQFQSVDPPGSVDGNGMVTSDLGSVQVGSTINVKIKVLVTADTTLAGSFRNTALVGGHAPTNTVPSYAADVTVASGSESTFVVTNTNDEGTGSLRQAILDSDSHAGVNSIVFQIPGAGVHTITPLSPLPSITNPTSVLGQTQAGFADNTATTGDNEKPMIEISGAQAGATANGLVLAASNCVVEGLVINRFGGAGIVVQGTATAVSRNFIGVDPTGSIAEGNHGAGVLIDAPGSTSPIIVGGLSPAGANLISANGVGIEIDRGDGNGIWNNLIGTDSSGGSGPGNTGDGVLVKTSNNRIGSANATQALGNVIAFNGGAGVAIVSSSGNTVRRNSIFFNQGPGIDLGNDGATPNAPGGRKAGPNGLPNFPVALVADYNPATNTTTISGALDSQDPTKETVDVYANPLVGTDRQGKTYLGTATPIPAESGTTVGTFVLTVPGKVSAFLSATANLADGSTSEFSPVQNALDSSGDGIADGWKFSGLDFNGDGTPDLVPGKDGFTPHPGEHDLFVEINYMTGTGPAMTPKPDPNALSDVATSFLNSGVPNADGSTGVHLNYELDTSQPIAAVPSITFHSRGSGPNDDFLDIKNGSNDPAHPGSITGNGPYDARFGTLAERSLDPTTAYNLLSAKRLVFRFCVFGYQFAEGPTNSGVAQLGQLPDGSGPAYGGSNFLITMATWPVKGVEATAVAKDLPTAVRTLEAATFMHEMGHTLGLQHGGGDGVNNKPNYLSIMNYSFQFPYNVTSRPLDYSHQLMPSLDENHLSDKVSLGGPSSLTTIWTETAPKGYVYVTSPANGTPNWLQGSGGKAGVATNVSEYTRFYDSDGFPNDFATVVTRSGTTYPPVLRVMNGYNDWANLHYNFRLSPYLNDVGFGLDNPNDQELPLSELEAQAAAVASNTVANRIASTASADVSAHLAAPGQPVRLTATITFAGPVGVTPGGTVEFKDGSILIGSAPLVAEGNSYVATLSTARLAAGAHAILAEYSGDNQADGSSSDPVTLTVSAKNLTLSGAGGGTVWAPYVLTLPAAAGTSISGWTIAWGDGAVQRLAGDPAHVTHVYSNPGSFTIRAIAASSSGPLTAVDPVPVSIAPASSHFGASADAFVSSLYRDVLARYPEPAGLTYWSGRYASHVPAPSIVRSFFHSGERRHLNQAGEAPKVSPAMALTHAFGAAWAAGRSAMLLKSLRGRTHRP